VNRSAVRFGAAPTIMAAFVAIAAASSAHASIAFNQDLAAPGVYFGTGNGVSPQQFTVNTAGGVEIALRSKISGIHPQVVPTGNTYLIPLGSFFNFDYSVNPNVGGPQVSFAGVTALITVTNLANGNVGSFNPSLIPDNATSPLAPGGYQNSEKISFGFLGQGYNPNLNDTFNIVFTLTGVPVVGTMSVSNIVQVGSGFAVPEPTTWAMMILGLGGVGATMRRARKRPALATA
jgi:hypothetical protein